ncbi:MAG: CBS domain-containing protein, partial [Nitrospinaceae bacterium]
MDKIENYMSEDLIVIDVGATIQDAAMAMRDNDVHSVIVKEEREYVGILTGVDITRKIVAPGLDPAQTKVSLIMESPLYTIDAGLPMDEALLAMKKNHTRHIVVTCNSNVTGILSINDFVRYHSQNINDPVAEFWS